MGDEPEPEASTAEPKDSVLRKGDEGFRYQVQRRRKTKGGRLVSQITLDELEKYFHMPSEKACKELGVGTTVLKRVCRNFGIPRWPYRSRRRRSPSAAASSSDSPSSGASPSPSRSSLLGGSASGAEASGTAAARPAAAAAAAVGAEHPAARLAWRTTPPAGPAMLQPSWGADAAAAAISPQLRLLSPPGAAPGQQGPRKPVGFRPYSRLPPDSGGSGQGSGEQQEPSQQAQQQAQQQLAGPTGPEPDAMLRLLAELAQPAAAAAATAAAAPLAQAPSGGRGEKRKRSPDHPVTVLLLSAPGVGPTAGAGLGPLPAAGLLPSRGSDETQASVAAADPELQAELQLLGEQSLEEEEQQQQQEQQQEQQQQQQPSSGGRTGSAALELAGSGPGGPGWQPFSWPSTAAPAPALQRQLTSSFSSSLAMTQGPPSSSTPAGGRAAGAGLPLPQEELLRQLQRALLQQPQAAPRPAPAPAALGSGGGGGPGFPPPPLLAGLQSLGVLGAALPPALRSVSSLTAGQLEQPGVRRKVEEALAWVEAKLQQPVVPGAAPAAAGTPPPRPADVPLSQLLRGLSFGLEALYLRSLSESVAQHEAQAARPFPAAAAAAAAAAGPAPAHPDPQQPRQPQQQQQQPRWAEQAQLPLPLLQAISESISHQAQLLMRHSPAAAAVPLPPNHFGPRHMGQPHALTPLLRALSDSAALQRAAQQPGALVEEGEMRPYSSAPLPTYAAPPQQAEPAQPAPLPPASIAELATRLVAMAAAQQRPAPPPAMGGAGLVPPGSDAPSGTSGFEWPFR